jgi:hypothetical protein
MKMREPAEETGDTASWIYSLRPSRLEMVKLEAKGNM